MIKINLAKVKKEERRITLIEDLKALKLQNLLKVSGVYYAGILAWIAFAVVLGYYWVVNQEIDKLRRELERINQEKTILQAQAKRFLEEKKSLEDSIARIRKDIEDIQKSKDIIVGLKNYYNFFNSNLSSYTSNTPKGSWISVYNQSLDIDGGVLKVEININSFDYQSISTYGTLLGKNAQKVYLSQVERKVNPHGFEYYGARFTTEKNIGGGM